MIQSKIDLYKNATAQIKSELLTVEKFHSDVKEGRWQDQIINLRAKKQAGKDIKTLKEALPMVTGSGAFKSRVTHALEKHSGFLVIDIDKLGARTDEVKEELMQDSLFYSVFKSCSGGGLCGFVRINPKAHIESFYFMSEHMFYKYGLNIDTKCSDIVRPRFVSYDPDLYLNTASQLCPIKPDPKKKRRKPKKYHFASEDFERIIADIKETEFDLTFDYQDWIYCGFALVDKFGEEGRQYFHDISQFNPGYDYEQADSKYTHLLETKTGDISIDWFYYIVELNGFQAYGKATEDFIQHSLAELRAYEAGLIDERPLSASKMTGLDLPSQDISIQIKNFLHVGYEIKKNEMTAAIEIDGEVLDDELLNTVYIMCRSQIEKLNSRELVYQVLDSRFTPRYHAFKDMMAEYDNSVAPEKAAGHIDALITSLQAQTPNAALFIKKWLVSIVGSMYGTHSPLMLILSGPQNCGKTSWFRLLLPERLRVQYYAESKLDEGKDDRILMSKKILIMDDEMSGKSKQEESRLKSTISQQQMDLRVPFGRTASSLNRIAVLCATSNEEELISDPTGNRRLLPIAITGVDFDAYNSVDKDMVMYEAYLEYMTGYNYELTNEEIALLKESTQNFKKSIAEEDMIVRYFGYPEENPELESEWLSLYEISDYIKARTRTAINTNTLGKYLRALEFVQKHKKFKKTTIRKYHMVLLDTPGKDFNPISE